MKIHLHLGAHKTASTFIQNWLFVHKEQLNANGVCYIPLEKLRNNISNSIRHLIDKPLDIKSKLDSLISENYIKDQNPEILIISEENFLGSPESLGNSGILYQDFHQRVAALSNLFIDNEVKVFLSIRSYDSFYPSMYAEIFRHGYFYSFDYFIDKLDINNNSWLSVINIIKNHFGEPYLWKYESFKSNYKMIIADLSTLQINDNDINIKRVIRQSLPLKAINLALASKGFLTKMELRRLVGFLADKMQYDTRGPKVGFNDPELIRNLQEKFNNECRILGLN